MEPRIIVRPGVGSSAGVLQKSELEFKRLFVDQPVLIMVERGSKALRWSSGEYIVRAGEAIAIAGGQSVDITNRPAADGSYRAGWLVWESALLAAHAAAHPQQNVIRHALPLLGPPPDFAAAFHRAVQAVADETIPLAIARHRAAELLVWIGMHGGRFGEGDDPSLATRVRRLVSQDLAREWSADAVSSALAMSQATLRRRLAEETTGLTEILVDTRMSFALSLLQSTRAPVTQIALHVGYQTSSHFAVRFRRRFGFPPTAVRGAPPDAQSQ